MLYVTYISIKLEKRTKKSRIHEFLSWLWLPLWKKSRGSKDKRKNMKREKVKGLHWWDSASFLPLLFSQLWLYVQSVYIPFKVLKLCLKFHGDLGSFSSWGLRHILLNYGNDPKVTQNPVWWIIKWEKLKSNETSSPMQFPKSLSQPFPEVTSSQNNRAASYVPPLVNALSVSAVLLKKLHLVTWS